MTRLYIDIETLPTSREDIKQSILDSIKPPGNIKKQDSIDAWMFENADTAYQEAYRKTALDGLYGEILSIAYAVDDEEPICLFRLPTYTEQEILAAFFINIAIIKDQHGQRPSFTWIGHNITSFDLRFIWQRCVINSVKPTISIPYDAKPWDERVFDTRHTWTGGSAQYSGKSSMTALAPVFDLNKSDIDGSMVYDLWLAGEYDAIIKYNKEDVIDARTLHKRMSFTL